MGIFDGIGSRPAFRMMEFNSRGMNIDGFWHVLLEEGLAGLAPKEIQPLEHYDMTVWLKVV